MATTIAAQKLALTGHLAHQSLQCALRCHSVLVEARSERELIGEHVPQGRMSLAPHASVAKVSTRDAKQAVEARSLTKIPRQANIAAVLLETKEWVQATKRAGVVRGKAQRLLSSNSALATEDSAFNTQCDPLIRRAQRLRDDVVVLGAITRRADASATDCDGPQRQLT